LKERLEVVFVVVVFKEKRGRWDAVLALRMIRLIILSAETASHLPLFFIKKKKEEEMFLMCNRDGHPHQSEMKINAIHLQCQLRFASRVTLNFSMIDQNETESFLDRRY